MKQSRLMRVPSDFYDTVKGISQSSGVRMTRVLSESSRILQNADALTKFIFGKRRRRL